MGESCPLLSDGTFTYGIGIHNKIWDYLVYCLFKEHILILKFTVLYGSMIHARGNIMGKKISSKRFE